MSAENALAAAAYIDTSILVAIALEEPGWRKLESRLGGYAQLFTSGLLEAELKTALRRERLTATPLELFPELEWVFPGRRLGAEIDRVLDAGYVKGADVWHLACALYLDPEGKGLRFETLDDRQRAVAEKLGLA